MFRICLSRGNFLHRDLRSSSGHPTTSLATLSPELLTLCERARLPRLADVASWQPAAGVPSQYTLHLHPSLAERVALLHPPLLPLLPALAHCLSHLSLSLLTTSLAFGPRGPPLGARDDIWSLALPRQTRQHDAEAHLLSLIRASSLSPLPFSSPPTILASDGSALSNPARVTFAFASPSAAFVGSLPHIPTLSSLHGELFGLVAAALHALSHPASPPDTPLYTDHLNSVRFLQRLQAAPHVAYQPSSPVLSLYSWLQDILSRHPHPPVLTYTPAHTHATSLAARANDYVDRLASAAHSAPLGAPQIPLPTFSLPDYCLHHSLYGYIESPVLPTLLSYSSPPLHSAVAFLAVTRVLYHPHSPPDHPYTRASSAYSATVQLYARADQLDTGLRRYRHLGLPSPACPFGCPVLDTAHHVFVDCAAFAHLRLEALESVVRDITGLLAPEDRQSYVAPPFADDVRRLTSVLFVDDASAWPMGVSRYYLGMLPPIPATRDLSVAHGRCLARVLACWHVGCIRLAARIWGQYKRSLSPLPQRSPAPIVLPEPLEYLLAL